jgi:hypothetical protein
MNSPMKSILEWSSENQLGINTSKKKKEMINSFGSEQEIEKLSMNGTEIERVTMSKLLGVIHVISEDLKWGSHVKYVTEKASKRLVYLRQMKHSGLSECDLLHVYKSLIRLICEYACPVWSTSLTFTLSDQIESIQTVHLKSYDHQTPTKEPWCIPN